MCKYRIMVEFGRVPGKRRIHTSIDKTFLANTEKRLNEFEYKKIVESRRVPGKCRIRATIEKVSRRVLENGRISVSTEKWFNPGEYGEMVESVEVSTTCHGEYRKMVELV